MNVTEIENPRALRHGTSAAPKNGSDFTNCLSKALQNTELSAAETYKNFLEARFGGIRIQRIEQDQRNMD